MDGIDAAAVEIAMGHSPHEHVQVALRSFLTLRYAPEIYAALLALCRTGEGGAWAVGRLHMVLGECFAAAAHAVMQQANWAPHEVSVIGSHGQTTVSDLTERRVAGYRAYSTLQLGSPAVIAERTGITTVADFRARDIAAGGRGAPLVPLVDALLYARAGHARALLNLGGIANLTLLPASGDLTAVTGFDTGPANMPLDAVMRLSSGGREPFDQQGRHTARGRVDEALLRSLLAHPFIQAPPPKATGSEEFGEAFAAQIVAAQPRLDRDDLLATLARFAADAVALGLRRASPPDGAPEDVLVSGGGTHNQALMRALRDALDPLPLRTIDEIGAGAGMVDAKEAVAFAVLGYLTLRGRAGNLPGVTGATRPVVLGSMTPGRAGCDVLPALDSHLPDAGAGEQDATTRPIRPE